MSVKPIIPNVENNNGAQKSNITSIKPQVIQPRIKINTPQDTVSFKGFNPIVGTMNFIEAGGYPAEFIFQDGLGFIAPRVYKGLMRGSEKTDENGQPVLDENGNQVREYNWKLARKEFIREIITGPSAFLIPLGMLHLIKKHFGTGNNVKLNYIEGFKEPFTQFVKDNAQDISQGNGIARNNFYKSVYTDVVEQSINAKLPKGEKLAAEMLDDLAQQLTDRQLKIEEYFADGSLDKKARNAKIQELGGGVDDLFMSMKKRLIGGTVSETSVQISTSKGIKDGNISELTRAMSDYFGDAIKNVQKSIKNNLSAENIENAVKQFTNRRMGSRVLTNLGIFGTVAAFYTQIPKLYKMGQNGNPARKNNVSGDVNNTAVQKDSTGKDVAFTGGFASALEKVGSETFSSKIFKPVSNIFELNGNAMSGRAMPVLLYGFCIPPRLLQADDKYDYGEIVFRDMTSFTAFLFGAKALSRLFSDAMTKLTGLGLNKKDMDNRNVFQKIVDYLNPVDSHHSVLNSKQLASKYTNIDQYKGGANGFIQFIEESGGDIKKAFAKDKNIKASIADMLDKYLGIKSYKDASITQIKDAINSAMKDSDKKLIDKFYDLFKQENGLLNKAKTCNSTFSFASLLLVPALIIWIANTCEKITARREKQDMAAEQQNKAKSASKLANRKLASQTPSMAGFLGHTANN